MKKSFKAFLKNAMVYALAASMLVSTPLTASASGLNGVFSISDGKDTWDYDENGNKVDVTSGTGTVTNTDTNTGTLADTEAKIIGLVLDQETVNTSVTSVGKKPELKATIVYDGDVNPDQAKKLNEQIRWEIEPKGATDTLSIKVEQGKRNVCYLNPKKGGTVKVTASILKTDYKATATVIIKNYATKLWFGEDENDKLTQLSPQYVKHTLDMNTYLHTDPEDAKNTEEITWSITGYSTNKKGEEKVDKSVATISTAGFVTFRKAGRVVVTAVSEKGYIVKNPVSITVEPGVPAKSIEIRSKNAEGTLVKTTKLTPDLGKNQRTLDIVAVMFKDAKKEGIVTDDITWSSNKPAIVDIKTKADYVSDSSDGSRSQAVTLEVKAPGTAKITAQASSGKKATLTVAVSATLNSLKIEEKYNTDSLYSGQTFTMVATRDPEENTEALKWTIVKSTTKGAKANPNATINAKTGLLTIKPQIKEDPNYTIDGKQVVQVQVFSTKTKVDKKPIASNVYTIELKQSSIDNITVTSSEDKAAKKTTVAGLTVDAAGKVEYNPKKSIDQKLSLPKSRKYDAVAMDGEDDRSDTLNWTSTNTKVATVDRNGKITSLKKGNTTIKVSGVKVYADKKGNPKYKLVTASFKVIVEQPATSITLNKTAFTLNPKTKKVKGEVVAATQTVSIKSTLKPSGAKDAKETVWSVTPDDKAAKVTSIDKKGTTGKVAFEVDTADLGDEYTILAKAKSGVTATATVKVLNKTTAVAIAQSSTGGDIFTVGKTKNKKELELSGKFDIYPQINIGTSKKPDWKAAGEDNTEDVTYTVNKKGIVQIIDGTVYAVGTGTVKITATTPANKKATLTVVVK